MRLSRPARGLVTWGVVMAAWMGAGIVPGARQLARLHHEQRHSEQRIAAITGLSPRIAEWKIREATLQQAVTEILPTMYPTTRADSLLADLVACAGAAGMRVLDVRPDFNELLAAGRASTAGAGLPRAVTVSVSLDLEGDLASLDRCLHEIAARPWYRALARAEVTRGSREGLVEARLVVYVYLLAGVVPAEEPAHEPG